MANSVSGQDESNPALCLATRDGKMELIFPLGTTRLVPQEKFKQKPYNKTFVDQVCFVKMAGYWPGFVFEFMDLDSVSVSVHEKQLVMRVSMGLTVRRKTGKNLAVRRKNERILAVSRKKN